MKKNFVYAALAALLCLAITAPRVLAAEGDDAAPKPREGQVTHAELISILIDVLDLNRLLPSASPTTAEGSAVLLRQRISPAKGWDFQKVVTKGDLAVVLVKSLRAMGQEIGFDADDAALCRKYLQEEGVPIDTIGQAVSNLEALPNPVLQHVFLATADPLKKRDRFAQPDEPEFGTDAEFAAVTRSQQEEHQAITRQQIVDIITQVTRRRRPSPRPTPDGVGPDV